MAPEEPGPEVTAVGTSRRAAVGRQEAGGGSLASSVTSATTTAGNDGHGALLRAEILPAWGSNAPLRALPSARLGAVFGHEQHRHAPALRPDAPLDIEQAAKYLNVTERFMRRLVAERRIAFHRVGRLLRFRAQDLDAFFSGGRVEPPPTSVLSRIGSRAR